MGEMLETAAIVGITALGYVAVAAAEYKNRHPDANLRQALLLGLKDYTLGAVKEVYAFYSQLYKSIRSNARRHSEI